MATRSYWNGSFGPFEYDDEEVYPDDGKTRRAFKGLANLEIGSLPTTSEDGDFWIIGGNIRARILGTVYDILTGGGTGISVGDTLSGDVTGTLATPDTVLTISASVLSAYGRTLIDDANAGAARTTLGLGSIATQNANNVSITGGTINGTSVGASTPSSGAFTTLSATGAFTGVTGSLTPTVNNTGFTVGNSGAAINPAYFLNRQSGRNAYFVYQTGGVDRIKCGIDGTESGSDAQGNYGIYTYTDAGVFIDVAFRVIRASGGDIDITRRIDCSQNVNVATGKLFTINGTQIGLSNGLAGVLVSSPSAGHMLLYDDTDSRFENVAMSGDATITKAGVLSLAAGLSNKSIYTNSTRVGNLGGGEDDLMTYTVPAGTLANTNERLVVHGVFNVDTAGASTLKAYWNGVAVYNSGSVTPTDSYISIRLTIIRTGATGQDIIVEVITASTTHTARVVHTTGAATLSGAVVVKFTGTDAGGTNDDIAQEWMSVDYIKTN